MELHIILGVAASTRVGNLIGSRSAQGAKQASHVSALLSVVVGLFVMIALMVTKDVRMLDPLLVKKAQSSVTKVFGYVFSDDESVVRLVSKVMPLVASFQVFIPMS